MGRAAAIIGREMTTHRRRTVAIPNGRARGLPAVVLILGALLILPTARPVSAASNGQWSVFPSSIHGQAPRAVFHPKLVPGEVYADSVTVSNYAAAPLTFHLYGADAINAHGGGLSVRRRTDTQTDIGRWIKLPYPELTVPARSASVVPFTILPPPQASPGDHVGGIVAEETQGTTSRSGSVPITVLQAVGVHVYGRVVGPLHPRLAVGHLSLSLGDSVATQFGGSVDAHVRFSVTNPGNTVLSPAATVELTTPFGTAARRTLTVGQLLPGNSLAYAVGFPRSHRLQPPARHGDRQRTGRRGVGHRHSVGRAVGAGGRRARRRCRHRCPPRPAPTSTSPCGGSRPGAAGRSPTRRDRRRDGRRGDGCGHGYLWADARARSLNTRQRRLSG